MSKLVAIHQPNFFPWLGYFDKIVRADLFIFMDNAQFPRTGSGSWINRVRMIVQGKPVWITMPVKRNFNGPRRICEMEIENSTPWREKMMNTLRMNYGRTQYFKTLYPWVESLVFSDDTLVGQYNVGVIRSIAKALGINEDKFVIGSGLNTEGSATDLLISMTAAVGGTAYLCGGGADGYQEDEKFPLAGLDLLYQDFRHPIYKQGYSEFVSGLSVLDALFHCGINEVRKMLHIDVLQPSSH